MPPVVATSYITQDGTAAPLANQLLVNGIDSIENNNNGIITKGGVAGTTVANRVDVVLTNRIVLNTTTADATPVLLNVLTPTASTGLTMFLTVNGYDALGNATTGGEQIAIASCSAGGVVAVIGANDTFADSSATLAAADWQIVTDNAQIQIELTGVAATSIDWVCLFMFIQSPSP